MLQDTTPETRTANRFRAIISSHYSNDRIRAMVDHLYLISGNWNNVDRQTADVLLAVARQH